MSRSADVTHATGAPEPVGNYPHARRVGNLLFLSGIGPRVRGSKIIPGVELNTAGEVVKRDIEAQCHSVFRNVRQVLEEAGSGWERLVDVTVFLTHMEEDFAAYNRIYAEYFRDDPPCRTTVEIKSLPTPISIELKCIATLPDRHSQDGTGQGGVASGKE
ncbi:MAG: RidA family protein [Gammaproteobacteria bacterium]